MCPNRSGRRAMSARRIWMVRSWPMVTTARAPITRRSKPSVIRFSTSSKLRPATFIGPYSGIRMLPSRVPSSTISENCENCGSTDHPVYHATISMVVKMTISAPAMNTPSVAVETGASFGWLSMNQPARSWLIPTVRATWSLSGRASMPTISTTRSAGTSISSPDSFSRTCRSMLQLSPGSAARTRG